MTLRGRKPKPTAKKKMQGNRGKRKLNKHEPQPQMSTDIKPTATIAEGDTVDGLRIEALRKEFREIYGPQLITEKLLTDLDQPAFDLMGLHYALSIAALEVVRRDGFTLIGAKGEKKHHLLQVVRENSAAWRAYAAEFGMTPSARSRLQMPDMPDEDRIEEEFFRAPAKVTTRE